MALFYLLYQLFCLFYTGFARLIEVFCLINRSVLFD